MLRIKLLGLDIYGCQEALERLDDYVDHELSSEEAAKVQQHLKICRHCLQKFQFEENLVAGLRAKVQTISASNEDALKNKIHALLEQQPGADPGTSA